MNLLLSVKVPIDLANELDTRLAALVKLHLKSTAEFQRKLRGMADPSKALEEQGSLAAIGRRITLQSIARVYLYKGRETVRGMTDRALYDAVATDPVVRGRPSAEARRGRAA